jgi:hypothetical protein
MATQEEAAKKISSGISQVDAERVTGLNQEF